MLFVHLNKCTNVFLKENMAETAGDKSIEKVTLKSIVAQIAFYGSIASALIGAGFYTGQHFVDSNLKKDNQTLASQHTEDLQKLSNQQAYLQQLQSDNIALRNMVSQGNENLNNAIKSASTCSFIQNQILSSQKDFDYYSGFQPSNGNYNLDKINQARDNVARLQAQLSVCNK